MVFVFIHNLLLEYNGNFNGISQFQSKVYIIMCFVIAAKSYTLWNWKFCHETPLWRKSIIVIGHSMQL